MIFSQIQGVLAPTSEGRNIPEMKPELTWRGIIVCAGMHIIPIAVFITESDRMMSGLTGLQLREGI